MLDWLKKRTARFRSRPEAFRAQSVVFVVEQDGDIERKLKSRLVERFQSNIHLAGAYLVQMRYDESPEPKVALCLKMDDGIVDHGLVTAVHFEFKQVFAATVSLDIMFLTDSQEREISRVACPFYRQAMLPRTQ